MTVGVAAVAVTAVPVAAPVTLSAVPMAAPVAVADMAMTATVSGSRVGAIDGRRRYKGRAGHGAADEQREQSRTVSAGGSDFADCGSRRFEPPADVETYHRHRLLLLLIAAKRRWPMRSTKPKAAARSVMAVAR